MYLINEVKEWQGANVILCSNDELDVIRELITRAHDNGTDWASYDDAVIISNVNQALNGGN